MSCFHNCPGEDQEEEEGFREDLTEWLQEIKEKTKEGTVRVVEVPEPEGEVVVHLLPNLPGQQYQEDIQGPGLDGSYHLRRVGEQVPEGVVPKRYIEIAPGEYMPDEEDQQQEDQQQEQFRTFEELFEEFREPYP